jgi:hypothetical protein
VRVGIRPERANHANGIRLPLIIRVLNKLSLSRRNHDKRDNTQSCMKPGNHRLPPCKEQQAKTFFLRFEQL